MTDHCFTNLLTYGKNIDECIKNLTKIWRYPHNILGGYGASTKEADLALNILRADITKLKEKIEIDTECRVNHMTEVDKFLEESQQMYEELVQSCNDIEIVLSEYGYVKPEEENHRDNSEMECSANYSLIASDVTDDLLEIEFTPQMSWRQKTRSSVP